MSLSVSMTKLVEETDRLIKEGERDHCTLCNLICDRFDLAENPGTPDECFPTWLSRVVEGELNDFHSGEGNFYKETFILYQVFENDKPADCTGFPKMDQSWNNSTFKTLEEAKMYLLKWLGAYGEFYKNGEIQVNQKIHYAGTTDFVVIKET